MKYIEYGTLQLDAAVSSDHTDSLRVRYQQYRKKSGMMRLKSGFRIRIHLIRIRIQHCRLNTDPDPGFLLQKLKNIYS
jgi:hypothetical protein